MILRGALAVLLLSDISFKSTYPGILDIPVQRAGLSPMNSSVFQTQNFNVSATAEFWWYFPALLSDTKRVGSVQPVVPCTGAQCGSYFMPGSMMAISLENDTILPSDNSYPDAISYIQNDAPGYQFDFYPIDTAVEPAITIADCRVYGVDIMALNICLKQVNETSLISGTSSIANSHPSLELLSRRPYKQGFVSSRRRLATGQPI